MKQSQTHNIRAQFYVLLAILSLAFTDTYLYMALVAIVLLYLANIENNRYGRALQHEIESDNDLYEHMNYE